MVQKKSLEEIEQIYESIGTQVFTQHPIKGTSNLVWSHSYYDTALWEKLLKEKVGTQTLISTQRKLNTPKVCITLCLSFPFQRSSFTVVGCVSRHEQV